jgi:hypothetical protein
MSESELRLRAQRATLQQQVDMKYEAIEILENEIDEAGRKIRELDLAILRAEAAADSDAYPVGTRVRHFMFEDATGVVVESDGAGLSILQDTAQTPSHGFTKREWVEI